MANRDGHRIPLSRRYLIRCAWRDVISLSALVWTSALFRYAAGRLARPFRPVASLAILSQAHLVLGRVWSPAPAIQWLDRRIGKALAQACRQPVHMAPPRPASEPALLESARQAGAVLKPPRMKGGSVVEKGVVRLKYSERIAAFHRCVDMEAFLHHYQLVLEPSWTGYAGLDFLAFTRYRNHPIVFLAPFRGDRQLLEMLDSNLAPIELGSGDWVDPRVFRPLDGEPKCYDAVMVARWSLDKRHDLLLRALSQIADPTFRVALLAINTPGDSDREAILAAIESSGFRTQIEVFEDVPPGEVNRILNRSKVNVLLSRQEGGNRGLFEGFFAGVPGIVFRNHIGIRVEHFRPETGRLIERSSLAEELLYFRDHWADFDPRSWAMSHITPEISTRRLNEFLKQLSLQRGEPWTRDIVTTCNRPHLQYYPDDDAGQGLPTIETLVHGFQTSPLVETRH